MVFPTLYGRAPTLAMEIKTPLHKYPWPTYPPHRHSLPSISRTHTCSLTFHITSGSNAFIQKALKPANMPTVHSGAILPAGRKKRQQNNGQFLVRAFPPLGPLAALPTLLSHLPSPPPLRQEHKPIWHGLSDLVALVKRSCFIHSGSNPDDWPSPSHTVPGPCRAKEAMEHPPPPLLQASPRSTALRSVRA